ncbi:MAG: coproporphyrinogen III oxidase [Crocinitomicaceae bacterium]|nr:coproporphyrinogen III oxidase [Crocinitomicaceae bacterium]
MSGIYIHIPFCKQACHYCDFHFSTSLASKSNLVSAITKEIILRKSEIPKDVKSLYIGGGTPSLLSLQELTTIFHSLEKVIELRNLNEITLEINPEDINEEKLDHFKALGINRLSIGVQSFDNKVLKWMNRIHSNQQIIDGLNLIKKYKFEDISIDFIYGTPSFLNRNYGIEISSILEFDPSHLSCYLLTIEEGTYFGHLEKKNELKSINDLQSEQEFLWLSNKLQSKGYDHYEISNFSLNGKYSFHNSNYWKRFSYIGFGPGAHSFIQRKRRWNISNNAQYIKKIDLENVFYQEEKLTTNDFINEIIMLGLRTKNGFNLETVFKNTNADNKSRLIEKIKELINKKLIIQKQDYIIMRKEKWLLSEYVSIELFTI